LRNYTNKSLRKEEANPKVFKRMLPLPSTIYNKISAQKPNQRQLKIHFKNLNFQLTRNSGRKIKHPWNIPNFQEIRVSKKRSSRVILDASINF